MILKIYHTQPDVFFYKLLPFLTIQEINELTLACKTFKNIFSDLNFWNFRVKQQLKLLKFENYPESNPEAPQAPQKSIPLQSCKFLEKLYFFGKDFNLEQKNATFDLNNLCVTVESASSSASAPSYNLKIPQSPTKIISIQKSKTINIKSILKLSKFETFPKNSKIYLKIEMSLDLQATLYPDEEGIVFNLFGCDEQGEELRDSNFQETFVLNNPSKILIGKLQKYSYCNGKSFASRSGVESSRDKWFV